MPYRKGTYHSRCLSTTWSQSVYGPTVCPHKCHSEQNDEQFEKVWTKQEEEKARGAEKNNPRKIKE